VTEMPGRELPDRETLDREYDAAKSVPNVANYIARYQAESKLARNKMSPIRDIQYGPTEDERLDLFRTEDCTGPLALFFHGGYWRRLHKNDFSFVAEALVKRGINVGVVNYGLAPKVPLREITAQAIRAVAYCSRSASKFGFNPTKIAVFGHSAGGQLAAMCALTDWRAQNLPDDVVGGLVSMSGLHELEPLKYAFANDWLNLTDEDVETLSPIRLVRKTNAFLVAAAGAKESDSFKDQARSFVKAWVATGSAGAYYESPDDNHYTICLRLIEPEHALVKAVVRAAGTS